MRKIRTVSLVKLKRGEYLDLTGQKFDMLTVIKFIEIKNHRSYWLCKCDCGNEKIISAGQLKDKRFFSNCGCDGKRRIGLINHKHGKSNTRLFRIWALMKNRCLNSKYTYFKNYGGRGITVCKQWQDAFKPFYEWAMANGYDDRLTLDRKNVNGNYEPENCRWATRKEQQNNMRGNIMLEYNGQIKTLHEWADYTGIPYSALRGRLKCGWSIDSTLETKVDLSKRR